MWITISYLISIRLPHPLSCWVCVSPRSAEARRFGNLFPRRDVRLDGWGLRWIPILNLEKTLGDDTSNYKLLTLSLPTHCPFECVPPDQRLNISEIIVINLLAAMDRPRQNMANTFQGHHLLEEFVYPASRSDHPAKYLTVKSSMNTLTPQNNWEFERRGL